MRKSRTNEELALEALKYDHKRDFYDCNNAAYQAASRRGILDKICSHMPKERKVRNKKLNLKWTNETLVLEALKFENKTNFIKNSWGAYQVARERGILNQICSHMPKRKKIPREKHSQFKWNANKIKKEALKHKTKEEFRTKSPGAYSASQDLKIFEEVCTHMLHGGSSSIAELSLFDAIKDNYPDTKKLVDRKAHIYGRPYIKGFEIDIFVPSLNLGIEYDGKYYHSFKGLKRARPHWPDEALLNYHEIKDAYFLSKNIKILHIHQDEWKKDKQACINKCLEFLRKT